MISICRDDVCNELQQLQLHLIDLQSMRKDLQKAEAKRSLLSKQAALITEAESLGTAIRSHPLNTLSQRYSVYKRTRDEFNACQTALAENAIDCDAKYSAYVKCLERIESQRINDEMLQLTELTLITKSRPPTNEFELVKQFLDNSAQSTIHLQCCQINSDLYADLLQTLVSMKQIFEVVTQYGAVARYHPHCSHEQHRVTKYAEWCRYLCEHRTVQGCRDIVTQFQANIGKNALAKLPLQQVVTFAYHVQAIIGDGQYRLQTTLEALNIELGHDDVGTKVLQLSQTHDGSKAAIQQCLRENMVARPILESVLLTQLASMNAQFLAIEQSVSQTTENLAELTYNSKWFVDELLAKSTQMFDLCRMYDLGDGNNHISNTIANDVRTDGPLRAMQSVRNVYIHLCTMNETFFNKTLGDILHGIISEDKSVLRMISAVSSLQEGLVPLTEMSTQLHLLLTRAVPTAPMDDAARRTVNDVKLLQRRLQELKTSLKGNVAGYCKGEMLFLEFNDMFDQLDECHSVAIEQMHLLQSRPEWSHLDQMRESQTLAVSALID